ncbi:odorant receptor Or2-like isoform X2 [Cylas formicarius]|uniref:odorant receptor Or2-like isoform X2 n=1 Tax=Cylas formicarius TaxID=197179 RepID=UPI0029588FEE|nr:odorant receptor Or2-like isoform X2 [Cylas formicarius]
MTAQKLQILNFSKYCMIFGGLWRLNFPSRNKFLLKLYGIYSCFAQIYIPLHLASMCLHFFFALRDRTQTTEHHVKEFALILTPLITEIAAIFCQSHNFKSIISNIMDEEENVLMSEQDETLYHHRRQLKFCRTVNMAIFFFPVCTALSMTLENTRTRFKIDRYNREHNATLEKPFPFEWYLYKFNKYNHQVVMLLAQHFTHMLIVLRIVSTKNIVVSCIIFTPSVLKRLQSRFRQMSRQEGDTLEHVRDLISQHQKVIRYVGQLNDSIRFVILMEYLLNSLNFAAVLVQFISFRHELEYSPLFYFFYLFVQTFFLGWSANEVKVQSEALSDALYESLWYEQNGRVKRMILYMILRSQKPLVLTIGPFDTMTTASAVRIMKASYSYVSLMVN